MRQAHRRQYEYYDCWDVETEQHESIYEPNSAYADAEKLYRFRLVVLSNFLTLSGEVEKYEAELLGLFSDLKPGGVALILGGTGDAYQGIYAQLVSIAKRAGLVGSRWDSDVLGKSLPDYMSATVVREAQHDVFRRLVEMAGDSRLRKGPPWPDYWSPQPSHDARSKFALRAFRSGRWPQ